MEKDYVAQLLKSILICLLLVSAALSFLAPVEAAENDNSTAKESKIEVYFNQNRIDFSTEPVIVDGRMVIPVRSFLEAVGSEVRWDKESMQVITRYEDSTITLHLDHAYAEINGSQVEMNPQATVVNGSTMVSLRFLAECLDLTLNWNAETRVAEITTKNFVPYNRVLPRTEEQVPGEIEEWVEEKLEDLSVDISIHDSKLYILATYGLKESGGYDVRIHNIEHQGNDFLVEVEYVEPSAGQYTFPALTRPNDLVYVDLDHFDLPSGLQFKYKDRGTEFKQQLPARLEP